MSEKYYVGADLVTSSNNGKYKPVSRITLAVDEKKVITAGDDTGFEIYAACPHATQQMANDLLLKLKGYVYQSFDAGEANLNPSAELGDGITAGGIYGIISKNDDDGSGYVGVSAPGRAELEDEYPIDGPMSQMFNREIASVRSYITKTSEEIKLGIEGALGVDEQGNLIPVSNSIKIALDGINLSVSNGLTSSTISLTVGETLIASEKIEMSGLVTFKGLEEGTTTIDGGCIKTDSLSAEALHLSGILTIYDGSYLDNIGGYIGYDSGFNGAQGIGIRSNEGQTQVVCTDAAVRISYGDRFGISQVVCNPDSAMVEGYSIAYIRVARVDRLFIDSNGAVYPGASNMLLGTAADPWGDIYAAGTSFSALVKRVEALEK